MKTKTKNNHSNVLNTDTGTTPSHNIETPSVSLPKGGGALKGIDEKFQVNSTNGTSAFAIPLPLSGGRGGFTPLSAITYNSGAGNGPCGLGWQLDTASISRSTSRRLPQYKDSENSDIFTLTGAEDLVLWLEKSGDNWVHLSPERIENSITYIVDRFRPRIEGSFSKIERWKRKDTGDVHWRTVSGGNISSWFGFTPESRIADPEDESRVFEWKLCKTHDDKGNIALFEYKTENFIDIPDSIFEKNRKNKTTQTYLKSAYYGNKTAWYKGTADPDENDFMFKVVLDYGEHDDAQDIPADVWEEKNSWGCRSDAFSSYRAGFEIRTYRRCKRILMFHCFDEDELPLNPYLVSSLELFYEHNATFSGSGKEEPGFSFLVRAKQSGHKWDDIAGHYSTKSLPESEFTYQSHEWDTELKTLSSDAATHLPAGMADKKYLWMDLFSEGIAGILTEQGGGWYYKSNLGSGKFSNALPVTSSPSPHGLTEGALSVQELAGDGSKYLVQLSEQPKCFYKLDDEDTWERMRTFDSVPNISLANPDTRTLDLTGDGIADLLTSTDSGFTWHPGLGEKGFDVERTVLHELDEEKGPAVLFRDPEQSIFLADMSGDGLADIVRIRNGEVCYWPNLGYGKFKAKVNMLNAPLFDYSGKFDPTLIRLTDIDGSGITDIVYLGGNEFRVWMNQNGNGWSENYHSISAFPCVHNKAFIEVMDFLGKGTACIVHSDPLQATPLQYIDLMGETKPHLMTSNVNNCGKEVTLTYTPSTQFYLQDKKAGKKWFTKLPFPVQCVSSVRIEDKISKTVFVSTYRYSHGYFDHADKEFRGFARVEQLDTESFEHFSLNDALNVTEEELSQPPVKSVSWVHTGAYLRDKKILGQCKEEYYSDEGFAEYDMPDVVIKEDLTSEEYLQAMRSCKGLALRSEVFADDGTELSGKPYSISESNCEVILVQPKQDNEFAVFQVLPSESISYTCDRNPADPRISHSFALEHDDIGTITKTASVVYPRKERPLAPDDIPDKVWDAQNKLVITSSQSLFTKDFITDDIYRLRAGYESKSFEIEGITQPAEFYFKKENLASDINSADEILYEVDFGGTKEKRLSSHSKLYFMKDDLSGAMDLGVLSGLGIVHKSYNMVFTENLVSKLYGAKVTDPMLTDAKYIHLEGDKHWWTPSGTVLYTADPAADFYIPYGVKDLFDKETHTTFDTYRFLPVSATNQTGHVTTVENDYRTLSPWKLTDPNLNRSAVQTDELGMVLKSAVMGKEGAGEGDTLEEPTSYMEYDLHNWENNGKPNYVHGYVREKHGDPTTPWLESYTYSDGLGNVIMGKTLTEPGDALQWDDVQKEVVAIAANPRWLGNGRTILNNKGNPVKQYEPYFSTTHEYEDEAALVETGLTPVVYYDPIGRVTRTVYPNGTFSKSEFNPWLAKVYDVNDTIKDSEWFAEQGSPVADPGTADPEKRNAWLASLHHDTPGTAHLDSLGKSFYAITDYGNGKTTTVYSDSDPATRYAYIFDQMGRRISETYTNMAGQPLNGKTAEKGEKWTFNDAMGRLVKTWDNDLYEIRPSYDDLHRPVSMYLTEKDKSEIMFSHIVFGDIFPDAADNNMNGVPIMVFDQSGMVRIRTVDFKGNPLETERQLTTDYKNNINWDSLDGLSDIALIEAASAAQLEAETFSVTTQLDALSRAIQTTLADGTVITPTYDIGNTLEKVEAQIRGAGSSIPFLQEQQYNAKGQRKYALWGNDIVTNYSYEAKTDRLASAITKKAGTDDTEAIQNLNYVFDPVGNLTYLLDNAQQTHFFKNEVVKPEHFYQYDALYQLISATGREHAGVGAGQPTHSDLPFMSGIPHVNDENAVQNYTEIYEYDDCGNIQTLNHTHKDGGWKRLYHYEYEDDPANLTNRLKNTRAPGDPKGGPFTHTYTHDSHGNMLTMPHLASLTWNFADQLNSVDLGGGGTAWYVYGASGNRTRKIIERQGGKRIERLYLGPVEIYREYQGDDLRLQRNTVHILDNTGRIAQVDTKLIDKDNADPDNPLNTDLIRYQYGNHIGSATIETDESGTVISYEEYHPFGSNAYRSSKSGTDFSLKRYRFSGKERDDETGFYYFGARYLAGWLGRWTSSDPGGFIGGYNCFRYCSNNPVNFHDPNGMDDVPVRGSHLGSGASWETIVENVPEGYHIRKGINATNYQEHWTSRSGGYWDVLAPDTPAAGASGLSGAGQSGIVQNPEGFTLEVPNSFDPDKINATQERILDPTDRQMGHRSTDPATGSRTDDIRARDMSDHRRAIRDHNATAPPNQRVSRANRIDMDHTVELQYVIRQQDPANERLRSQDRRPQPRSDNRSQGRTGRNVADDQITRGVPEDSPAGGVARSRDMGQWRNSPRARAAARGLGFGMMAAGPVMNLYGASQVSDPYVSGTAYALGGAEALGVGAYAAGRWGMGGWRAASQGLRVMGAGAGVARFAGGGATIVLSTYALVNDYQSGEYGVMLGDTAGIVAGGAMLAGSVPVAAVAGGVAVTNAAGDWVERQVTPSYGRTAGVGAGTATGAVAGAAIGAAIGVWCFGVGAVPAAAVGGVIGGIAGFVGAYW